MEDVQPAPAADAARAASADERAADEARLAFWVTNVSHAVNHFQNQMVAVLYPVIMAELGFGYAELGVLNAVRSALNSGAQVLYGFFAQFARRALLLSIGNLVLAGGTALSGLVGGYAQFVGARGVAAMGASAQHPVGSSLLAGYFPKRRGTVLAFNASFAQIGSIAAPIVAALLLLVMGWRQVFVLVSVITLLIGVAYLLLRDRVGRREVAPASTRARLAAGRQSYLRVLRNRNFLVISGVMMVGAAGRGEGVNVAYLGPHFVNDLGLTTLLVGVVLTALQVGGLTGPLVMGWLSDRLSRGRVMQASLLLSAVMTLAVARLGPSPLVMLPTLFFYGAAVYSRNPQTQAIVADALRDEDRDAAFSLYYFIGFVSGPIWTLLTGVLMDRFGFAFAWSVLAASYLAGMLVLFLLEDAKPAAGART